MQLHRITNNKGGVRAVRHHTGNQAVVDSEARLKVTCWCERTYVNVPASVIKSGGTTSCGHFYCQEAFVR